MADFFLQLLSLPQSSGHQDFLVGWNMQVSCPSVQDLPYQNVWREREG
jgi:hypothetical protein